MKPCKLNTQEIKRLDLFVLCYAQGMSSRQIERKHHVDRRTLSMHFMKEHAKKPPYSYTKKVVDDVLTNKLTYLQVFKKHKARGLCALLWSYMILKDQREKELGKKIIALRDTEPPTSFHEIARILAINVGTAMQFYYKYTKYKNKFTVNTSVEKSKILAKQAIKLFNQGKTPKEIGKVLNRHPASVITMLAKRGISARRRLIPLEEIPKIKLLRDRGLTWREISFIYGVGPKTIGEFYLDHYEEVLNNEAVKQSSENSKRNTAVCYKG